MAKIFWNWTNFIWWEADNPRVWPQHSVQEAHWVNLKQYPWEVHLWNAMQDTWRTINWSVTYMANLADFWGSWILVCTDTWNIYLDWTLKTTLNTWSANWNIIIWAWSLNIWGIDYLYLFWRPTTWSARIHRITLDMNVTNLLTNHIAYTTSSWIVDNIWVITEAVNIIFWIWNKTYTLDINEVVTPKLVFAENEMVMGITSFLNKYKVYTSIWLKRGRQYFWDGITLLWDYKTEWQNTPILWVTNEWWLDMVVTWFNSYYSNLYRVNWVQRWIYKANQEDSSIRNFYRSISSRQWIFYISAKANFVYWVYSLGNYYAWYPETLSFEHLWANNEISAFAHDASQSYFWTLWGKVYKVFHQSSWNVYNSLWRITSLIFDWWTKYKYVKKQIDYAYVWFQIKRWTSIKIYARADWGTFKLLKTLDSTFNNLRWTRIDRNEFIAQWLWDAFDLEYKVELIWDNNYTPIFRWIETYITTNIDK